MNRVLYVAIASACLGLLGCSDDAPKTCQTDTDCGPGYVCGGTSCLPQTPDIEANIVAFSATPTTATPGQNITLSWEIASGRSATITWDDRSYDIPSIDQASGSLEVLDLQQATTFTLTVLGSEGSAEEAITVSVETPKPVIDAFSITPQMVPAGSMVDVAWTVQGASEGTLLAGQDVILTIPEDDLAEGSWTFTARVSTTLTLRVINEYQESAQAEASVTTVGGEPRVTFFGSTRTSLVRGQSATLQWNVENADTITLADEQRNQLPIDFRADGSLEVTPDQDTTFTLTATNDNGADSEALSIEVFAPIQIETFTATPNEIPVGNAVALAWKVSGDASSVVVQDQAGQLVPIGGSRVLEGSVLLRPTLSEVYTITAGNAAQSVRQTAAVTVLPAPPTVTLFEATPNPAPRGSTSSLRWRTSGADSVTLENVTLSQSIDVSALNPLDDAVAQIAQAPTTYRLTATNAGGSATADLRLEVLVPVALASFAADQSTIAAGQSVTFSWETSNATSLQLESGLGVQYNLGPKNRDQDSITITPSATDTYTFTANGFQGPLSASATVTVIQPPTVNSFTASDELLQLGTDVALTWATSGATTATLTDSQGNTHDVSALNPASDTFTDTPATEQTTYTLTVSNSAGQDTATVAVTAIDTSSLHINEVFNDAIGSDDGLEWVELYNSGTRPVDLQYFSLGAGGTDYTTTTLQLAGTIAPGTCFVVGGLVSSGDNGNPFYDQPLDFSPDLQNGGAQADGIGLFFELAADLTSSTTPIDSVLWGDANTNNLLGESGLADTVLSPNHPAGSSLERIGVGDLFRAQPTPSPNQCVHISNLAAVSTSNQSSWTLPLRGWALDAALDQVDLGNQTNLACTNVAGGLDCNVGSSSDAGAVDVVVTRGSQSTTLPGVFLEQPTADPGVTFWCGIVSGPAAAAAGQPIGVDLEIYVDGFTGVGGDVPNGWIVEATYFAPSTDPETLYNPTWVAGSKTGNSGNNVVYQASVTSATPQVAEVAFRVSPDGVAFYYCDTVANGGSDDGYSTGENVIWN